jgi:hypothetical protein
MLIYSLDSFSIYMSRVKHSLTRITFLPPIPLATFAKKRRVWADQGMRVGDRTTFDTRTEGLPDVSGWAGPECGIRG